MYAALYRWNVARWHGDAETAAWLTSFGLAGAVALNLVLLVGVAVFIGLLPTLAASGARLVSAVVVAGLFLGHYLLFVHDRRYEKVHDEFSSRAEARQQWVTVFAWAYIMVSYLLPALVAVVAVVFSDGGLG